MLIIRNLNPISIQSWTYVVMLCLIMMGECFMNATFTTYFIVKTNRNFKVKVHLAQVPHPTRANTSIPVALIAAVTWSITTPPWWNASLSQSPRHCVRGYEHCKSTGNLVPGVGAENLYMKGVGMLVVSLRGVNFRFWSHLGCSGENAIMCGSYVAMSVLFRVSHKEI